MLQQLPLEIVYEILVHVPFSQFQKLYQVLPRSIVTHGLRAKLQLEGADTQPLLELVSTNRHELLAPEQPEAKAKWMHACMQHPSWYSPMPTLLKQENESTLPLFFTCLDLEHDLVWLEPNSTQYYFEVKDLYVSHGKMVLRQQPGRYQKVLGSLWDIRCRFLSGSKKWSASSPRPNSSTTDSGTRPSWFMLTLDASSPSPTSGTLIIDAICHLDTTLMALPPSSPPHEDFPPRPLTHTHRMLPPLQTSVYSPWQASSTCGYFCIDHVAISLDDFLAFFQEK
ncbi:hypothetical protein DM01DRAFT_1331689 [Hesseltinella vesiculosa]|uniref:F-box domain-containing protein n=1 Tax=Hesseltinella vesiculosa TaxID=101127 RepID=A0A1X2GW59_9FUNG|nr:hypothetical protein DM01DRAFT_1331689 [Hesseltinella vesiculosa]